MNFIFDETPDRRKTNSVKWNRNAIESISANADALPFWVADMDFYPEPHIKAKAEELAGLSVFGYPSFPDFEETIALWLKEKHSWKVDKENILFSMGLLHGVALALNLYTAVGDAVLVPSPTYRPFREIVASNKRVFLDHSLGYREGKFFLDRERFRSDAEKAKLILFCSPHNPSGLVFSREDLTFVLETAKRLGIPVISDEIHGDLVHPGFTHLPMGMVNEEVGAETVTLMAPSKTFNVAGEHSAFAVFSSMETKERFRRAQKSLWLTEPGYLIGELTETAYRHGLEWNKALSEYLGENANLVSSFLEKNTDIRMVNGNASFVTFLDCSKVFDDIKAYTEKNRERFDATGGGILSRFFGLEAGVAMNDGTWFGKEYEKFVRFNYGTKREMVEEALKRIKNALDKVKA